jgi:hypothetical protein
MDDDQSRRGAGATGGTDERPSTDEQTVGTDDTGAFDDPVPHPPIEPESVDPEHAAFVVIGVMLTVGIIVGAV